MIPELHDKCWLKEQYVKKRLSSCFIAKTLKCRAVSVLRALEHFDIPRRTNTEIPRLKKGFKAKKLNDRLWLSQKYLTEKLNPYEIAKIVNSNQKSVRKALLFHAIPIRGVGSSVILRNIIKPPISSFNELNDRNWLIKAYKVDGLSSLEIGKILDCDPGNVVKYLRKHNIEVRSNSEAQKLVEHKSNLYLMLNDREWLDQKYTKELLSTNDICSLVGAKVCGSVRQSLIRHGIPVRNISDGLTCDRDDDGFVIDNDVIEGSLLGDGGLTTWNRDSEISNPCFYKKNKFYDHVNFVASKIFPGLADESVFEEKCTGNYAHLTYYKVRSLSYKSLKPYDKRWYPKSNNFIKVIPDDLVITPNMLLHFFMDDGCSQLRKRPTYQCLIMLCSQCFSRDSQELFCEKLKHTFGLRASVRKTGREVTSGDFGCLIYISQLHAGLFYDIIGPPPVPSLAYKWKSAGT